MNLGETLNIASHAVEEANTPRLDGVLSATNWNDESKLGSPANREGIIRSLLNHFGGLDLRDENLREDSAGGSNVLGDAYEYLIDRFADDAGKKGGEFYTPRSVVRLIVELLQPQRGNAHLRPHCRLRGYAHLRGPVRAGARRRLCATSPCTARSATWEHLAIGKLNLLLHGLRAAQTGGW